NIWQEVGFNSLPSVPHDDPHARAGAPQSYPHMPAFGGELDGVRYKIPDDLLQSGGVAGKLSGLVIKVRGDDETFAVGGRAHGVERRSYHYHGFDRLDFDLHFAGDDAGRVEQIFDQLKLRFPITLDGLDHPGDVRIVAPLGAEHIVPT